MSQVDFKKKFPAPHCQSELYMELQMNKSRCGLTELLCFLLITLKSFAAFIDTNIGMGVWLHKQFRKNLAKKVHIYFSNKVKCEYVPKTSKNWRFYSIIFILHFKIRAVIILYVSS